jgi:hypothetical protein
MASDHKKTGVEAGRLDLGDHLSRATSAAMKWRHVDDGQVVLRQAKAPVWMWLFTMAVMRLHSREKAWERLDFPGDRSLRAVRPPILPS